LRHNPWAAPALGRRWGVILGMVQIKVTNRCS
jgi:hypothetical protein